jgi:hypothetical protein
MYKVFLRFPEALRPAFSRLKDKLEDPDSGELCDSVRDCKKYIWSELREYAVVMYWECNVLLINDIGVWRGPLELFPRVLF